MTVRPDLHHASVAQKLSEGPRPAGRAHPDNNPTCPQYENASNVLPLPRNCAPAPPPHAPPVRALPCLGRANPRIIGRSSGTRRGQAERVHRRGDDLIPEYGRLPLTLAMIGARLQGNPSVEMQDPLND